MRTRSWNALLGMVFMVALLIPGTGSSQTLPNCTAGVVSHDIVYVRAPRFGDNTDTLWPEVTRPMTADPGAELRLLHPNCTEELLFPLPAHQTLVDAPLGHGVVLDPNVSFDGNWVVFAYIHDQRDLNTQRNLSRKGADIYRLNLGTREVVRLTFQEFTPNTGNNARFDNCGKAGQGENCPNVGVFNIGPAFVARADPARPAIAFTSSRNNFLPPKQQGGQQRVLQLFMMDWQGRNVEQIGYLNQSMALHPIQLADGRLAFTSWENQGMRDGRQFNLWFIAPDGKRWNSASGLGENAIVHHFMTQMSNQDLVVVRYYNQNNNGFGDLVRFPVDPAGADFLPVDAAGTYMPFQRKGQLALTRWTDDLGSFAEDFPAPCAVGHNIYNDIGAGCAPASRIGKVTHPAVAPSDKLLLVYTPGAANSNHIYTSQGINQPFYDGGLYLMASAKAADGSALPSDLIRILNRPEYNEQWPRPVVPYSVLFPGRSQPTVWPAARNAGPELPADSPLALVGSASLTWRDTHARKAGFNLLADGSTDPDPFNASHERLYAWVRQGADAGLYGNDDIHALRILAMIPRTDRSYPNNGPGFFNHGDERLRILGEIAVRHEGVLDANGHTDTSFLARIPADVPFTFQTLDRNGMVLNMAQTWHHLRPGEARYDCGGCHAHSKTPLNFNTTVAGQPGFPPTDLALQTPLLKLTQLNGRPGTATLPERQTSVEYNRDIKPILSRRCAGCHSNDTGDGKLNLFDDASTLQCGSAAWPGTYYRLAIDRYMEGCPKFGLGVPAGAPTPYFIEPQVTRYLRPYQSRQSLLIWKVFGARLDGRTNANRTGDIDYDPAADPVHRQLDVTRGLTWDEKLTFARWVDLGAPIETRPYWGWFEDDLRPTLWTSPTFEQASTAVSRIRVGAYDLESGIAPASLNVSLSVPVGGFAAGTNFAAGLAPINGGVLEVALPASIDLATTSARLRVSVADNAGHRTVVERDFGAGSGAGTGGGVDLRLRVSDSPDPVAMGYRTTLLYTITNAGAGTATQVTLTDRIPSGFTLLSARATQGSCVQIAAMSCALGTLAPGASATVTVLTLAAVTGTHAHTARATAAQPDSTTADNAVTVSTTVTAGDKARLLSVSVLGTGKVSTSSLRINCPADCSENYLEGTAVTLRAAAATGFKFAGWSGACTGLLSSCTVSMTQAREVVATFVPIQ